MSRTSEQSGADTVARLPSDSAIRRTWQRLYRLYGVRANVTVGARVHIGLGSILWAPRSLHVGPDVYVGKNVTIQVDGRIGAGTLIANQVGIVGRHDHDMHQVGRLIRHATWVGHDPDRLSTPVDIGSDVWIGYGAVVLGGVSVGRGAVVGAGSVVTRDIPPYAVVTGTPGRVVAMRFDDCARREHEERLYGQVQPPAPSVGAR